VARPPSPVAKLAAALAPIAIMTSASGTAWAQTTAPTDRGSAGPSLLDRPHTVAELEIGGIALPTAPIAPGNRGNLPTVLAGPLAAFSKGDATLLTSLHLLYRASTEFAIGADARVSPAGGVATDPNTQVQHQRNYMELGVEGRYYPVRYRSIEGWLGLTAAIVVIADRYTFPNLPDVPTFLGRPEVTQRAEGFSYGVQAGADYLVTDSLVLGLTFRADRWLLPQEGQDPKTDPACSSVGNCPTLGGTVEAFEFGLKIGYRIPL